MLDKTLQRITRLVGYGKMLDAVLPHVPQPVRTAVRSFHLRREIRRATSQSQPVVLVYTAPKVASTAVTQALQAIEGLAVYQVHIINPASVNRLTEEVRRRGLMPKDKNMVYLANTLYAEVIKTGRRAKIISLVREPVGRNISYYFEVLDLLWKSERAHEHVGVDQLVAEFHERFSHDRGIKWFDNEFKPTLGIDVYEHPFPHDLGFLRIDSGPYEVLIMRHDLDDREKEKRLANLIGVPTVSLTPKNVSSQKAYSAVYREFLDRINLSDDYVDDLLDSKYARHFFSAAEIARVRATWLGGGNRETSAITNSELLAVKSAQKDYAAG